MKRSWLVLPLLLLLALATVAQAKSGPAAPAPKPDPRAPGLSGTQRLAALMDRVHLEQQAMKTLEARFVQRRESSLLLAPEQSNGTFSYAAPSRVRWEYTSPNPISVLINGSEMTTWYRDLKRAERLKIGRYSNQVLKFLGASGSMQALLEYFKITLKLPDKVTEPYQLDLVPKFARVAKRVRSMSVWIDAETFFPSRLRYVEGSGDVTDYQFKEMKVNAHLPEDRFVLKIPEGVETRVIDLDQKTAEKDSGR